MGTVYLAGLATGSWMFGSLVDTIGRKRSLLLSCAVTPLVQIVWLVYPYLNLTILYAGILILGLAAATRSTSSYLFAIESLWIRADKVQFGTWLYMAEGFGVTLVSLLFWSRILTWRSYCIANCVTMMVLLGFVLLRLPESPVFLFEGCRFDALKECLVKISFSNGCYSSDTIEHGMRKLKQQRNQEQQIIFEASYNTADE